MMEVLVSPWGQMTALTLEESIQGGATRAENPRGAEDLEGRRVAGRSPGRDEGGDPEPHGRARARESQGDVYGKEEPNEPEGWSRRHNGE